MDIARVIESALQPQNDARRPISTAVRLLTYRCTLACSRAFAKATVEWLASHGIHAEHRGAFVRAVAPRATLAAAFPGSFVSADNGRDPRCPVPPLEAVAFAASPTLCGPEPAVGRADALVTSSMTSPPPSDMGEVTPDVLRSLYGLPPPKGNRSGSMACAEWEGQAFSAKALSKFEERYSLPPQALHNITGEGLLPGTEANLDVQYIIATAPGVPCDFWQEPSRKGFDLIEWITSAQARQEQPLVWSVSYGESMQDRDVKYVRQLDAEFAKLALAGTTIVFASGDAGAYSRQDTPKGKMQPGFPAGCPSVLTVGATTYWANGTEDSAIDWSGGGFTFSEYFTREADAPWQNDAVQAYLAEVDASGLPPNNTWDPAGVGFPDVAAVGTDYMVTSALGFEKKVSGTSASTPVWAGVIALLNDERLARGMPPIGAAAPWLYAHTDALKDIVLGRNNNDGMTAHTGGGYVAAAGWDPTTGFGAPLYGKLLAAALKDGKKALANANAAT